MKNATSDMNSQNTGARLTWPKNVTLNEASVDAVSWNGIVEDDEDSNIVFDGSVITDTAIVRLRDSACIMPDRIEQG